MSQLNLKIVISTEAPGSPASAFARWGGKSCGFIARRSGEIPAFRLCRCLFLLDLNRKARSQGKTATSTLFLLQTKNPAHRAGFLQLNWSSSAVRQADSGGERARHFTSRRGHLAPHLRGDLNASVSPGKIQSQQTSEQRPGCAGETRIFRFMRKKRKLWPDRTRRRFTWGRGYKVGAAIGRPNTATFARV